MVAAPVVETSADAVREWLRCGSSFWYFCTTYVKVSDPHRGIIPFEPWPHLEPVADSWQAGASTIDGKGRQLGFSYIVSAFALWKMTFFQLSRILAISMGERESKALLGKVTDIRKNLPTWLQLTVAKDNSTELSFTNGSSMVALPSTENAGRSETASVVISDELAFHPFAGENYAAYRSAIADGGQHIIISTGNGPAGLFANFWNGSGVEEATPYIRRFTPWSARPDRGREWYDREYRAFLSAGDKHPLLFIRENPSTPEEMLTAFFGLVYDVFKPAIHIRSAQTAYEACQWRVAAVDPGQGDPAAISVIGQNKAGHAHQYGEWRKEGVTTIDHIWRTLVWWYRRAPLHAILVDDEEGTIVATLNARFRKVFGLNQDIVHKANKDRPVGIGQVAARLERGDFTIEPGHAHTLREFQSYRWQTRRATGETDPYTTSTPVDHHGDLLDTIRYCLMHIAQYLVGKLTKQVGGPNYSNRLPGEEHGFDDLDVQPDRDGNWIDPLARRLARTGTLNGYVTRDGRKPARAAGGVRAGPIYTARSGASMRRLSGRRR